MCTVDNENTRTKQRGKRNRLEAILSSYNTHTAVSLLYTHRIENCCHLFIVVLFLAQIKWLLNVLRLFVGISIIISRSSNKQFTYISYVRLFIHIIIMMVLCWQTSLLFGVVGVFYHKNNIVKSQVFANVASYWHIRKRLLWQRWKVDFLFFLF